MRVAIAQISCTLGDVASNLAKIEQFAARAKDSGAELVLFPEMVDTGYAMATIRQHAKPWSEGVVPRLQQLAAQLSMTIVCGLSEREGAAIYNSQIVVGSTGEIVGRYRKTHLFTPPPIAEDTCFTPGDCLADFPLGPFHMGLSICYDLRFSEVYRTLTNERQANVLLISSAWPFPRVEHFRTLASARAIENQSYVIAANRVGTDNGVTFCGSSAVIDPAGVLLAAAGPDREDLIYADLSKPLLDTVRDKMPVLDHRRPEIYR